MNLFSTSSRLGNRNGNARLRSPASRPRVEALETRITPTLSSAFNLLTGVLTITSDAADDTIHLSLDDADNFLLNGNPLSGLPLLPSLLNTTGIEIEGGGGNDLIRIDLSDGLFVGLLGDEISIAIDAGGQIGDVLQIFGQDGADDHIVVLEAAVDLNGDGDADVTVTGDVGVEVNGLGGDDLLEGGLLDDILRGGIGDDTLTGGLGDDILEGGAGIDRLIEIGDVNFTLFDDQLIGLGVDVLEGFEGVTLIGGDLNNIIDTSGFRSGPVIVEGQGGDDVIIGTKHHDFISGGEGNDQLYGRKGNDTLDGGPGDDHLFGEKGNDTLLGKDGNDVLNGGKGRDNLQGGTGDDSLTGGGGKDMLDGGEGIDWLLLVDKRDTVVNGENIQSKK